MEVYVQGVLAASRTLTPKISARDILFSAARTRPNEARRYEGGDAYFRPIASKVHPAMHGSRISSRSAARIRACPRPTWGSFHGRVFWDGILEAIIELGGNRWKTKWLKDELGWVETSLTIVTSKVTVKSRIGGSDRNAYTSRDVGIWCSTDLVA